jgi:hypothetical protein
MRTVSQTARGFGPAGEESGNPEQPPKKPTGPSGTAIRLNHYTCYWNYPAHNCQGNSGPAAYALSELEMFSLETLAHGTPEDGLMLIWVGETQ